MKDKEMISEVHEVRNVVEIRKPTIILLETDELHEMPHSIIFDEMCENMNYLIELSYSFDGVNFSKWFIYKTEIDLFNNYLRDDYIKGYSIKLQFKITTTLTDIGSFDDKNQDKVYYYIIHKILINKNEISIKNMGVLNNYKINQYNPVGLWNPYDGMGKSLDLYKSISKSMNDVLGHWVYYFKTDPDKESKNIHLRSFELFKVVDMKKIKVMVPSNKFPSAMNIYHEFGISFPDEFNIHILQDEFEFAFGPGQYPKQRDYLYFPINNIMYEVNAFYKPRTFMEKSIYSELVLNKYEHDTNVDRDEFEQDTFEYMELFDDGTLSADGFKEMQDADPNYMNLDLLEAFRLQLHKDIQIVENPLYINGLEIFKNEYLFTNILNNELGVSFNAMDTLFTNITFSGWFMFENTMPGRRLVIFKDRSLNNVLEIGIRQRCIYAILHTGAGDVKLTSNKLEINTQYGIGISVSNTYSEFQLSIINIIDGDAIEFHTSGINERILPLANSIKQIELYGGPHLISNIRLDDIKVSDDNFINHMTSVLPNAKTNILFDKAHVAISNDRFTM